MLAGIIYAVFMISSCNSEKKEDAEFSLVTNDSLIKR